MMPKPPREAPLRSVVVKMSSYRMKEELLRVAWQKQGFQHLGKRVNLDHDYAPAVLKNRREYAEAKTVLKEKKIRFQTPFPARLRVFYQEGVVMYGSAEEGAPSVGNQTPRLAFGADPAVHKREELRRLTRPAY